MPNQQINNIEIDGTYYTLIFPIDANISLNSIDFHNVIEANGYDVPDSLAYLNHMHLEPTGNSTYGNTLYIDGDLYMAFHRADSETYYPYFDFTTDVQGRSSYSVFKTFLPCKQDEGDVWNLKKGTKLKFTGDYNYLYGNLKKALGNDYSWLWGTTYWLRTYDYRPNDSYNIPSFLFVETI